jgi:hypothetical protein
MCSCLARGYEFDDEKRRDRRIAMDRLMTLIRQLKPLDRADPPSFLKGMEAAEIGEITGDYGGPSGPPLFSRY